MSSNYAIKVENLSKSYQIYDSPQDRLKQAFYSRLGKIFNREFRPLCKEFTALSNISLEVKRGETLGIIGLNGSGKSTLLQLICGTLNQSSGSIVANGRIAALLELGSGFNPEFSGHDNVYMNAALLGLSHCEITQRYQSILNFADIGDFINQPVKTYSSGMVVRLAFAVIAHVSADVLIVDEALSVGDAVFTQKCMRFIREFQKKGTLLFVSHDMGAVLNICNTAVWLDGGVMKAKGDSKKIAEMYLEHTLSKQFNLEGASNITLSGDKNIFSSENEEHIEAASKGFKTGFGELIEAKILNADGRVLNTFKGGERVSIKLVARAYKEIEKPILGFLVRDRLGQDLFGENTLPYPMSTQKMNPGNLFEAKFTFVLPLLPNGDYSIMASFAEGDLYQNIQHHWEHVAIVFNVSSEATRWGLVGISFEDVALRITE